MTNDVTCQVRFCQPSISCSPTRAKMEVTARWHNWIYPNSSLHNSLGRKEMFPCVQTLKHLLKEATWDFGRYIKTLIQFPLLSTEGPSSVFWSLYSRAVPWSKQDVISCLFSYHPYTGGIKRFFFFWNNPLSYAKCLRERCCLNFHYHAQLFYHLQTWAWRPLALI